MHRRFFDTKAEMWRIWLAGAVAGATIAADPTPIKGPYGSKSVVMQNPKMDSTDRQIDVFCALLYLIGFSSIVDSVLLCASAAPNHDQIPTIPENIL